MHNDSHTSSTLHRRRHPAQGCFTSGSCMPFRTRQVPAALTLPRRRIVRFRRDCLKPVTDYTQQTEPSSPFTWQWCCHRQPAKWSHLNSLCDSASEITTRSHFCPWVMRKVQEQVIHSIQAFALLIILPGHLPPMTAGKYRLSPKNPKGLGRLEVENQSSYTEASTVSQPCPTYAIRMAKGNFKDLTPHQETGGGNCGQQQEGVKLSSYFSLPVSLW